MPLPYAYLCLCCAATLTVVAAAEAAPKAAPPIRVLVVTGGHDFEEKPFWAMFSSLPGLEIRPVAHPKAQALLKPSEAGSYDVVVLYDMWQDADEQARADFAGLIRGGKGLVALHHSLCGYDNWPEYHQIIGGQYHHQPYQLRGVAQPASTYKHDVLVPVHVVDPRNPVTKGVSDFELKEETYHGFTVDPKVKPLLTTTEPTSEPTIGWAHTYGKSRVVYLALGHDHVAYAHPSYRRLLLQAIRWAARR
ncbi:MAG TPA: ThuA domain-containing protein [Armatimonadota bacterium]|jgi:hypothetical protein